jgi:hypothetical protein
MNQTKIKTFARKCDVTQKGMNAGYVFGDGAFYCKYKKDALKEVLKDGFKSLEDAYDKDYCYYTEWDEEDYQYAMVEGKLVEIEI